ncbi:GDYXXLXY domain-containing protein [Pelagerythrobacter rhizovicinus]|uniref:GDYXXLXY domain-containing protein n=1 Tax=Pelagerythrobacter rhizovicinus TaxID=2268576 RepID=A0A4Q2KGU1_9SPHN|nr:GDYXXLXY domain-containing protein [Pelagerythrobacter rhizovicinus]RXZ64314.1 hypothetical protein ETX26_10430 [Pelagerythrobacter rhizovicinus]
MNRRLALTLALALPLAGLATSWATTHRAAQQGTEWLVPIGGYDPRDLLRGHYVIYTYDWPGLEGGSVDLAGEPVLCLEGQAPDLARVYLPEGEPCEHPVRASGGWNDPEGGLASGRLYVSQERAAELQRRLADSKLQGIVRIRVREDGHLTPLDITFHPRPADAEAPVEPNP